MASAFSSTPGATMSTNARSTWTMRCASGWFWQSVPSRFHVKATASRRRTSMPMLARASMVSSISTSTSGFA